MITRISIEGFKSLRKMTDLKLGRVNVFIGANGSGKSNLLEALGVLSAAASGRVDDRSLLERGVRVTSPALYKTSLQRTQTASSVLIDLVASNEWKKQTATYHITLQTPDELTPHNMWTFEEESLDKQGQSLFSQLGKFAVEGLPKRFPDLSAEIGYGASVRGYPQLEGAPAQLLKALDAYAVFSPSTPVLRGIQPDTTQRDPIGLLGGRLTEAVESLLDIKHKRLGSLDLEQVLELLDWVEKIDTSASSYDLLPPSVPSVRRVIRFTDRWMRQSHNQLSAYDVSEGALHVLFMLTMALHPRTPAIFAVDTFDQAMHPRLARAMTRLFCRLILEADPPRQALLTTHNPMVLDGLDLANPDIRLFAVDRNFNTKGETRVYPVEVSSDVLKAKEDGLSLSNLWVMGRLGGVPDLF